MNAAWIVSVLLEAVGGEQPCRVGLELTTMESPYDSEVVAVRSEIDRETRCFVRPTHIEGVPNFTLTYDDQRNAHLVLVHPDGRRLERDVALEGDQGERARGLAIVAAHMLRNEADELLASLTAAEPEPPPPTVEPEPTEPVTPESDEPDDVEPDPAEPENVEPDRAAPETVEPEVGGTSGPPIVRLALGALLSSVPAGSGYDATFVGGLEVAVTPTPYLAIGLRDLGGSGLAAPEGAWAAGGALFAELAWRFDDTWSIHGELGVDARVMGDARGERAGVAPFVIVGGRVQILRELSIAAQTGLHFVATDAWATTLRLLPQAAILWSGGLSIAVHL